MRIGIYTQQLYNNYGGILQNFALQQVLKNLGHNPITIDFRPRSSLLFYLIAQFKTIVYFFIPGQKRKFRKFKRKAKRDKQLTLFINKYISVTHRIQKIFPCIVSKYKIEAIIVGSDQVWRPKYNILENSFLSFAKSDKIVKIAYAASFGVDNWEYTDKQTKICSNLVKHFKAVSVRETSGIHLCREYLNIKAVETLDPTLLLDKNQYISLCTEVKQNKSVFMAVYILDINEEKIKLIDSFSRMLNFKPVFFSAEFNVTLSIQEWLSMFRDASYVITDSFHGTVFSIINEKPFISIVNEKRGADRFFSLLSKVGLENRIMTENEIVNFEDIPIDWNLVSSIIDKEKQESINFLKEVLNNNSV